MYTDEYFMREALKEASKAFESGEVPVGAVIVADKSIIARAFNYTERLNDVTAHAEMQAITSAANAINGKYLHECTMFVTIEPCLMCAGAIAWSQMGRLVYGAQDEKKGYSLIGKNILHPKTKVQTGLLAEECAALMTSFFRKKRNKH